MSKQPEFWSGLQDKNRDEDMLRDALEKEFVEHVPIGAALQDEEIASKAISSRRDFLKYLGFSIGAATVVASCDIPIKRAIPYVVKPDDIVPGIASYYASSFVDGGSVIPILVKTREGRPIKIEGNSLSSLTSGGTNARAQASVLGLYNTFRYQSPVMTVDGSTEKVSWKKLDSSIKSKLSSAGNIRIVSNTINSPSGLKSIEAFGAKFGNTEHIMYDGVSYAAHLEANVQTFGMHALPDYHFDKANVIVSFDADFLGTWISPVEFSADYVKNRKIEDVKHAKMSRHIQFESRMSYTGANADQRVLVKPSEMAASVANLNNAIANATGGSSVNAPKVNAKAMTAIKSIAKELLANKSKSIVASGVNDLSIQLMINNINQMLGNWSHTMNMSRVSYERQGDERKMQKLLSEIKSGSVGAVIFMDCNPVFELPNGAAWEEALAKVNTVISLGYTPNETYKNCNYIAPIHHSMESWGDAQAKKGVYSLVQPTISPLFDTRQAELSLLAWSDSVDLEAETPYHDAIKANWKEMLGSPVNFGSTWTKAVHDGVHEVAVGTEEVTCNAGAMANVSVKAPSSAELEVNLYETINLGAGQHADNPWLQELADPIMRTVWGNFLSIPVKFNGVDKFDTLMGLDSDGKGRTDIVGATLNGNERSFKVVPQFGQMAATLAVGIGYGRKIAGRCGNVGEEVNSCLSFDKNGFIQYWSDQITLSGKVDVEEEFACVQYHHTYGVTATNEEGEVFTVDEAQLGFDGVLLDRSIMRYGTLDKIDDLVGEVKKQRANAKHLNDQTLYPGFEEKYKEGHHWSMFIDMNACTGCGNCVVACMAENNVPIVGKREVHRHHEMTWIRIDRYYFGDAENPNVVYQPMICQHCDNAPCENVCPVAATNHSTEGLNQMTYNRCIGTRYCANNCPFKVRRFNWLDYTSADLFGANENYIDDDQSIPFSADNLTRMVLNPDVTVRSRGVIEKCSFCVQRLQEGKLLAKRENRALADGDINVACESSCPTGAIIFGDDNDKKSQVSLKKDGPLVYQVLEEINIASSVNYSAKVVNRKDA